METLREQRDSALFSMRQEVHVAQEETQRLRKTLEASGAQREQEISSLKGNLETTELEKWRKAAAKYEREINSLQASHQQQNQQREKAAKQQGAHGSL